MRILIIGASRGIGRAALRQALDEGHDVRALARRAALIPPEKRLGIVAADATDARAMRAALDGADAVIQCVGAGRRVPLVPVRVFSGATRVLVDEMARAGIPRLVAVTGFGAGDSRGRLTLPERGLHRLLLGPVYDDKDRQEVIIRTSPLDWLIVRPTFLTNGPRTGRYRVLIDPRAWRNGLISRADVADFLVREATRPELSHLTPVLAY